MTVFPNRLNGAALSFITATAILMITQAGASSSKPATSEPPLPSPTYGTSTGERHEEQVISDCDHKADQARVSEPERMDFIRKCLEDLANDRG
jgi:hypothetical protein